MAFSRSQLHSLLSFVFGWELISCWKTALQHSLHDPEMPAWVLWELRHGPCAAKWANPTEVRTPGVQSMNVRRPTHLGVLCLITGFSCVYYVANYD